MVPLYAAKIGDLGPDDLIRVECACGHLEHLSAAMMATAGVPDYTKVLDLQRRLKCSSCRWKGRADVSIQWAVD